MSAKNTSNSYGSITKSLHWIVALAVMGLLAVGLYMTDLPNSPDKFKLYGWHKMIGICVLALMLLRFFWHRLSKKPDYVTSLKPWEKKIAGLMHGTFYFLLIAMPLSGWLMSSAANFPVNMFGLFTLPNLIAPNAAWVDPLKEIHEIIGWAIIVLLGLHIAAAIKHHFIDKDETLKRMLP